MINEAENELMEPNLMPLVATFLHKGLKRTTVEE